jgi:hypothetical protein
VALGSEGDVDVPPPPGEVGLPAPPPGTIEVPEAPALAEAPPALLELSGEPEGAGGPDLAVHPNAASDASHAQQRILIRVSWTLVTNHCALTKTPNLSVSRPANVGSTKVGPRPKWPLRAPFRVSRARCVRGKAQHTLTELLGGKSVRDSNQCQT